MRYLRPIALLWLAAPEAAAAEEPSDITVITWAHYLRIGRLARLANASFGPAVVHPQPRGPYRAVVGEVASGAEARKQWIWTHSGGRSPGTIPPTV